MDSQSVGSRAEANLAAYTTGEQIILDRAIFSDIISTYLTRGKLGSIDDLILLHLDRVTLGVQQR